MDKLSNYIKNGKPVTFSKLGIIFLLVTFVLAGLGFALGTYLFYRPDFQDFIKDIPPIEIQDGKVQKPLDLTWEKDLNSEELRLRIDTTKDTASGTFENGFLLTRQKLYVYLKGEGKELQLPQEKTIINTQVISKVLFRGIINLILLSGALLFLLLWIGYLGTWLFSRFAFWCLQKSADKGVLSRSLLVGWLSVFSLDFLLFLFGYGFSLSMGILFASLITLFCALRINKES